MSIESLVSRQNADGGFPYSRGRSWTEPTVFAVLALLAEGETEGAARGIRWLAGQQREDGGWAPQAGVDQSTWVTALVALLSPERLGSKVHSRAIEWLLRVKGEESTFTYRVREKLLGNVRPADQAFVGWPWMPGNASWVGPTAASVLALGKELRRKESAQVRERLEEGRRFLLVRTCEEGGWNHGAVRSLGFRWHPYPETTGIALAALHGVKSPLLARSVTVAKEFLRGCRSADAVNWLRLGLLAHGELPADYCLSPEIAFRTLPEASLQLLVSAAQSGRDVFWV